MPEPPPRHAAQEADRPGLTVVAAATLVLATILAYVNSFSGPFIYDDLGDILENPTIRSLWPPWNLFATTVDGRLALLTRPVVNLSFALNHAIGGFDPRGWHATNLAIHLGAGLLLFALVRRSLRLPGPSGRFGPHATGLAWAIALLWSLHPLQTESVTYIAQRYESIMGFLYLLTLYAVARAAEARPQARAWTACAITACFLAMGSKEVAVSLPIAALLYDRAFLSGGFREAWRARKGLHLGLMGAWGLLALLQALAPSRGTWAGLRLPITPWEYARSQFGVLLHYLRLAAWPDRLVLDYQWPIAHGAAEILPGLLVVAALLGLTLHALVRSPRAGFLGALFFMVLAPTSSVMPLGDLAVEHRMYLPLAPVVAMAVLGCHALLRRADRRGAAVRWLAPALLAGAAAALGAATHARNALYLSPLAMWKDNIAKVPGSFRAHYNAGLACVTRGALDEGERYFAEANRLAGGDKDAEFNLGVIGAGRGDAGRAIAHYEAALRLAPDFLKAHVNLGNLRLALGDAAQAARHFEAALRKEPASFEANTSYGALLSRQGEWDRAAGCFGRAREARPGDAAAGLRYAEALLRAGRAEAAEEAFRAVLVASPGHPLALRGLEAIRASGR